MLVIDSICDRLLPGRQKLVAKGAFDGTENILRAPKAQRCYQSEMSRPLAIYLDAPTSWPFQATD